MSIPTVYTSADASAPQITSATAGTGLAVIRACLVDGYGSKAAAGWTEEFTGTNVAVFRNAVASGATGAFFKVSDTSTSFSNAPLEVTAYRSMSDINTGDDPTHTLYGSRSPNGGASVQWWLWATEKSFYFTAVGAGTVTQRSFIGAFDLADAVPGDAYRYGVLGATSSSTNVHSGAVSVKGSWSAASTAASGISLARDHNGLSGPMGCRLLAPDATGTSQHIGGGGCPSIPAPNSAAAAAMPAFVVHGAGSDAVIRGRLPGILVPLFNTNGFEGGDECPAGGGLVEDSLTSLLKSWATGAGGSGGGLLVEGALDWGD